MLQHKNIKFDVACQYTSTCIIIRVKKHVKIGLNKKKNCSCVLQILCVEQNYSNTSYSLVKFPALSFKIKIEMIRPPSSPTKNFCDIFSFRYFFSIFGFVGEEGAVGS
jgi:hypothetical protein